MSLPRPAATAALVLALTALQGAPACERGGGEAPADGDPAPATVAVRTLERQEYAPSLQRSGVLQAWHDVVLVAKAAGEIVAVPADMGDAVAAGQVLLQIDDRVPANRVRRAEAALHAATARRDQAARDLRRKEQLVARDHAADAEIEAARLAHAAAAAEVESADAELASARIGLDHTRCTAPFAGVISVRHVDPGAAVAPGAPLFGLVAMDSLRLVLGVVDAELGGLAVGGAVTATVPARPERRFAGRVRAVGPRADPATGTFPVELVFRDPEGILRPGMVAEVTLPLAVREARLLVPVCAVREQLGQSVVFVAAGDSVQRRAVRLGSAVGESRLVRDGLAPGERVVVSGLAGLRDGQRVRIVAEERAP